MQSWTNHNHHIQNSIIQLLYGNKKLREHNSNWNYYQNKASKINYLFEHLATFLHELKSLFVNSNTWNVFAALLQSFWYLNSSSTSSIKGDIDRQSFTKKVLSLSPGAWKFEGSWVRSQLWLQAYIIYTIKITFKLSFPMAQELFANSVFYRNKHKYTVVRSQCNKTGPFGPNHIFFIKSLILGVHEWIQNYFDCFLLKKSFKMTPLLSTCDQ